MNQELVQAFKDNFRKMANEMHTAIPGKSYRLIRHPEWHR